MEVISVEFNINPTKNSKSRNETLRSKYDKVKSATAELILSTTVQGVPNIFRQVKFITQASIY